MYNREAESISLYPYHVTRMSRVRGGIWCQCEEGDFFLKEYAGGVPRLTFLRTVQEELEKQEIRVDTLVQTTEGEELSEDTYGKNYTLRKWFLEPECDPRNPGEVIQGAEALGRLTTALLGVSETMEIADKKPIDFLSQVQRKNREMKSISNLIARKRQKNEFDMEFRRLFLRYYEQGRKVEALEEQWDTSGKVRAGLCHKDFTHHNVLLGEAGVSLIRFDNLGWDSVLSDPALYIRKVMEKNGYSQVLCRELLGALQEVFPLTGAEKKQLYLRLAYPSRFLKVANHYASTRKNHITLRDLEKLKSLKKQEEERLSFLAFLEGFA